MINNEIIDSLGRVFKLKEINGKARAAFYRALGPKDASNPALMMEFWSVMAVDEIDGKKQPSIKQLVDVEYLAAEIDKSDASALIEEWLQNKVKEKQEIALIEKEEGVKSLKK